MYHSNNKVHSFSYETLLLDIAITSHLKNTRQQISFCTGNPYYVPTDIT
jgi:hypothetical protein